MIWLGTMRCKRLVGEAAAARAARSTAQRAAMGEASSGPFSRVDADLPPPRGFVTGAVCGAEAPAKQRGELVADTFREDTGWGEAKIGEGRRPRIRERLLGHDAKQQRLGPRGSGRGTGMHC